MDNICIEGKLLRRLTFNPGLMLTGFCTTRPRCLLAARKRLPFGISSKVGILPYAMQAYFSEPEVHVLFGVTHPGLLSPMQSPPVDKYVFLIYQRTKEY